MSGRPIKRTLRGHEKRFSGGPCFLMVPEKDRIELAGFVYEAHTEYEVIRVRQANLIATDGTIAPPPVGAHRRVDRR